MFDYQFSDLSIEELKRRIGSHHLLYKRARCSGIELEENVFNAILADPEYKSKIHWEPGSHRAGTDIEIDLTTYLYKMSVKSGTWIKKDVIKVSGNRLGKYLKNKNFPSAVEFLMGNRSHVTLCTPMRTEMIDDSPVLGYDLVHVPQSAFVYPDSLSDWTEKKTKAGGIAQYEWRSPDGMLSEIKPSLAFQIWWEIPRSLCEVREFIPIPCEVDKSCFQKALGAYKPRKLRASKKVEVRDPFEDITPAPFDPNYKYENGEPYIHPKTNFVVRYKKRAA